MQYSRDSSVWRTLAAAFGDGLAFGVGVALTRNAAHLVAARSAAPELESKARLDLETLTAQARFQAEADMQSMREQMAAVHEEFARTLERLVDDRIAAARQIDELRERVERQERNLLNLVMALGQSCLQAAGNISAEEPAPPAAHPELPALA